MGKFCDITTRNELADFLKIPRKKLTHILYVVNPNNSYKTFEIPKKKEGTRTICAPSDDLKVIQKRLSVALYKYQKSIIKDNNINTTVSHAFERGKSIITNARIHRNKTYVINIDLENFFESFHFGRVCGYFKKNRYFEFPHKVSVAISQLVCYNGKLPQGAPTSPIITNLICQILDMKILKLAKKHKLDYTRYADDITFSTNDKGFLQHWDEFYTKLVALLQHEGFSVNEKKTRIQYKGSKQVVTGLVVNKKVNIDKTYYKQTRAMANSLYTKGEYFIGNLQGTIEQLEGRFSFINQLDKYNNIAEQKKNKQPFRCLNAREKQYQKFLFYKYFYASKKPLIVTEGKTDILYLKAALKNLYLHYPNLIEKKQNGTFNFKIKFLNRTERMEYFFGMSADGADSLKNLCKFYVSTREKGYTNYFKIFSTSNTEFCPTPVILLFDNELSNKEKPLYKFTNGIISEEQRKVLRDYLTVPIIDGGNFHIVTNPLISQKEECEIEDLFDENIRNIVLDGKTLCLKDHYDINKHYGKDIFSQYILNNCQNIDFSNFKPLLDNINKIISK